MDDDFADRLTQANRISIRAVVVPQGHDPVPALHAAGIYNAIAIPFTMDGEKPRNGGILGDGMTPNVVATLEPGEDQPETAAAEASAAPNGQPDPVDQPPQGKAVTSSLPAAYGMKPLAPVRKL